MGMHWKGLSKTQKADLIAGVWSENDSAAVLAEKISKQVRTKISRQAILGVYKRNDSLGESCPLREPFNAKPVRAKTVPLPRPKTSPLGFKTRSCSDGNLYDQLARRVPFAELKADECHWPLTDSERPGDFLFCGCHRQSDSRYCDHHYQRSRGSSH